MAGQLVKRGKNVWLVRVYLGRASDGKRKWHNHTVHGRKEDAQAYLTAYLRDRDLGRAAPASRLTVDELLERYLSAAAGRLAVQTWTSYKKNYRVYVSPALGHHRLDRLMTMDIQAFYDSLRDEKKLAPNTIQFIHTSLSAALTQAVRWRLLPDNPARGTLRPTQKKVVEPVVFDPEAARHFIRLLPASRWGVLLELALASAARPEEYLGLTWPCVDWKTSEIRIERVLVWLRGKPESRALLEKARPDLVGRRWSLDEVPKTAASRRSIVLPPTLMERLREHRKQQMEAQARAGSRYERHGLVFANGLGGPLRSWPAARALKDLLRQAGLPEMSLYDLRRSLTTLLLAAGEYEKVVAERGGHSVRVMKETYAQVLPTMQRQLAVRIEDLLYSPDDEDASPDRRQA